MKRGNIPRRLRDNKSDAGIKPRGAEKYMEKRSERNGRET